jgi:serine/threonine protein kinase
MMRVLWGELIGVEKGVTGAGHTVRAVPPRRVAGSGRDGRGLACLRHCDRSDGRNQDAASAFRAGQRFEQRLRREARTAARLDEPHVVPIYDVGEINGRLYVAMRLITGEDLQTLLNGAPLPPDRAIGIIEQVASALHAAHPIQPRLSSAPGNVSPPADGNVLAVRYFLGSVPNDPFCASVAGNAQSELG